MIKYIPNILSLSRLFFAVLIVFLLLQDYLLWAFISGILASLTDVYDGVLAREYKVTSHLGSLLDPIMDKFFVLVLAAFYEQGTVAPNTGELWKNIKNSYGFGTRIVLSSFIFRMDLGFSEEGREVTVFFDYPF